MLGVYDILKWCCFCVWLTTKCCLSHSHLPLIKLLLLLILLLSVSLVILQGVKEHGKCHRAVTHHLCSRVKRRRRSFLFLGPLQTNKNIYTNEEQKTDCNSKKQRCHGEEERGCLGSQTQTYLVLSLELIYAGNLLLCIKYE